MALEIILVTDNRLWCTALHHMCLFMLKSHIYYHKIMWLVCFADKLHQSLAPVDLDRDPIRWSWPSCLVHTGV